MKKVIERLQNLAKLLGCLLGAVVVAAALVGFVYLDFTAYCQRFPQAQWWTYLFRGRGR